MLALARCNCKGSDCCRRLISGAAAVRSPSPVAVPVPFLRTSTLCCPPTLLVLVLLVVLLFPVRPREVLLLREIRRVRVSWGSSLSPGRGLSFGLAPAGEAAAAAAWAATATAAATPAEMRVRVTSTLDGAPEAEAGAEGDRYMAGIAGTGSVVVVR